MEALFPVEVERFAAPAAPGMGMFVDDLGMLSPPGLSFHGDGGLTGIRALACAGSLSLLGEQGAGKTTALRSLIEGISRLDAAGPGQDAVLEVPLAEVTDRAAFREMITGPVLARIPAGAAASAGLLTLVLDGLDQCPLPGGARVFAGLLRVLIGGADTAALRVLISCRSADYPAVVDELLTGKLASFTSYELAPLSRADIRDLTASRDVEPDAFLSEVSRSGTGPLACLPLSLDVLVRHYLATGGLDGPPAQLYETALLGLAGEPDRDRDPASRPGSPEQILAVAARLCCYLLLCGRAAFWTGPPHLMPAGYLEPLSLAGGEEHQVGGPFTVTTGLVDAALHSALFTTRGPGRRAPAHATFAACLAARHLAAHDLPGAQLRSLLTAGAGGGVIPALRETAAWLLARRPDRVGWLTDAELASLAVHAAIINDPQIRRALTERLLADPPLMLHSRWGHSWNLAHPGLAGQLAPVLDALADPAAPQPGRDQSYVALTLAREAKVAGLMPSLLKVAARPDAVPWLRAQAVHAAVSIDADGAASPLTGVLAEITAHPDRDPDDEIRGITLTALWPAHLPVQDLVANLTRPRRDNLLGAYFIFRRDLPSRLADADVPHLLSWALPAAAGKEPDVDDDLIAGLLDRAFTCRDMTAAIGPAADLVAAQLQAYRTLTIPAALDEHDDDGAETGTSRDLRRLLAAELLGRHPGVASQLAIWAWQPSAAASKQHTDAVRRGSTGLLPARRSLLDAADLPWLLQLARAAGPGAAGSYVPLLQAVFDPLDPAAQEAAWQTQEVTGLWPAFASWFDHVDLGGEAEAMQRRIFEASRPRPQAAGWDGAAAHAVRVLDLYGTAGSDTSAFEELLWLLQIDPVTGHGQHSHHADLGTRPGITLLPPDWAAPLGEVAWNYLHQRTPPGPDLLDRPGSLPWPAEAGYLALAHLVLQNAPGRTLAMLDSQLVARQAAPILAYPQARDTEADRQAKQALLARLAQAAPDDLPGLISRLAAGHLASGSWPAGLEALDSVCTGPVGDALARHLRTVTGALATALPGSGQPDQQLDFRLAALRHTITVLVRILAQCGHAAGIQAARDIIADATAPGAGEAAALAARAAAAGLLTGAARHWGEVTGQMSGTPSLLRAVLRDLADDMTTPFLPSLSDAELADLWNTLKQFWPYQDDDARWTSGAVGADHQAQRWRDGVLDTLARRGTSDAAGLLQQIAESNPDLPWLADYARRAQDLHRQRDWAPLSPGHLTRLFRDVRARLVRDIAELTAVVLEALDTLQDQALWSHGWSMLLWNRVDESATGGWWPAWEDTLSNLVCAFLREHLAERKPVINREVEIQPRHIDGARTDIHVQASDPRDCCAQPLTVIIEVKGCWNTEIRTGVSGQLIPYLQPHPGWAGIFLVGYFHHPGGEHPSYTGTPGPGGSRGRHRTTMKHTPDQVLRALEQQIADARPGNITRARVLRFPLSPPPASGPAAPQT